MKKILTVLLAISLIGALFVGCTDNNDTNLNPDTSNMPTYLDGEALGELLNNALPEDYRDVVQMLTSSDEATDYTNMVFEFLTLDPEAVADYAMSVSLINIQAFGVGIFRPVDGNAAPVQEALETYVENTKRGFENYLADQYEIANNAIVKTIDKSTVVLIMCEDAESVLTAIEEAIEATKV